MEKNINVRWSWLKFMYIYTIVGAGGFGLGILAIPETIKTLFQWPAGEPISLGIVGSVYAALGIVAILGLRDPLKFVPLLLLQLCYKILWFIGVIIPLLLSGHFPGYAILFTVIFASYILGDLVSIPFSYVFKSGGKLAVDKQE